MSRQLSLPLGEPTPKRTVDRWTCSDLGNALKRRRAVEASPAADRVRDLDDALLFIGVMAAPDAAYASACADELDRRRLVPVQPQEVTA